MDRGVEMTIFLMGATLMLCLALVIIGVFGNDNGVLGYGFIYGQGEQIGYVSEVANNGVFWKPTEVRLINSEPTFSKEDTSYYYAVASADIEEKARTALRTHEKVVIKYEIRNVEPWVYSHRVVITDIQKEGQGE